MESLLPSEIARLVLGYLEDQKCDEAARSFLESSPHLHECRAVISSGGRFSTRVNSFTLGDILEKFCAANAIIHERMSKVADCEQLKHCGDLLEQLRFLVDGSRGQRFVVNINVPTTSQASVGSPIISSSMRKRRHSGGDRDRSKRPHKSHSHSFGKNSEPISNQLTSDAVETTPLEHLPGHSSSENVENLEGKSFEKSQERPSNCSSFIAEVTPVARSLNDNPQTSLNSIKTTSTPETVKSLQKVQEKLNERCSAATDTEELMQFTNTEVQTTPYDAAESENESNNEPVENLSLLTKELLNRTELQERIAENINKAILPSDISLRDVSLTESVGGEMNTSIMTELNNAIKSVVTATESDPVFAKFLDEIIGPNGENDTSPDEDGDHQSGEITESVNKPTEVIPEEKIETPKTFDKIASQESLTSEIPLKNQISPEENQTSEKLVTKDDATALEDVNAAAILSIINANNKSGEDKDTVEITSEILHVDLVKEIGESVIVKNQDAEVIVVSPDISQNIIDSNLQPTMPSNDGKKSRKTHFRKPRVTKQRPKVPENENHMMENEIMTMPTLIVCSKEEVAQMTSQPPIHVSDIITGGYRASKFLPIAPKTNELLGFPSKPEPLYLRAISVPTTTMSMFAGINDPFKLRPQHCPEVQRTVASNIFNPPLTNIAPKIMPKIMPTNVSNVLDTIPLNVPKIPEKITLYGNENSAITVLENSLVPTINMDQSISISGTGLSPYLKFNNEKPPETGVPILPSLESIDLEEDEQPQASTSKQDDSYDHITKRTPRSLLKSRSKNNRLSLSTPRRRSNHIRALDFNTPTKGMRTGRRMSINDSMELRAKNSPYLKKICRSSLFKSPPFTGGTPKKLKTPSKERAGHCKIPIATRSPAPKLMGGWDKYTGVGMILGTTSSSSASSSPSKITTSATTTTTITTTGTSTTTTTTSAPTLKSWDEDLRKSLQLSDDTTKNVTKKGAKRPAAKRRLRKKVNPGNSSIHTDEASSDLDNIVTSKPIDSAEDSALPSNSQSTENKSTVNEPSKIDDIKEASTEKMTSIMENANIVEQKISSQTTSVEINTDPLTTNDVVVKTVKKKYAQLKTITTNVTRIERIGTEILSNESAPKSLEFSAVCPENVGQLPDMLELETPRKFDTSFGIPPTPRLLSPSNSMTTPFAQLGEDVSKVRGFVLTPEFPPTPSIAITPKQSDDTVDATTRKDEFDASSSYYQPSNELKDPRVPKQNDQSRHDMSLPLPGMLLALAKESRIRDLSTEVAEGFQASTSNNKLEITQFEVIKENLPREEAFRELKISNCTNESAKILETIDEITRTEISTVNLNHDEENDEKDLNNTSSAIDDSSDSDSSSSSDSSTSSSSSSSSDSSGTNTSINIPMTMQNSKSKINKIYTDTSNDSTAKNVKENCDDKISLNEKHVITLHSSRVDNENSPKKVFSIAKTDDELKEMITETPAKDDSLLDEAVISETPSSSKLGIETTNLNSKISALITSENCERDVIDDNATKKAMPKIVSVQRILPNVSIALKPPNVSETHCDSVQNTNENDGDDKFTRILEEKRLRLMAKIKKTEKPTICRTRIKRTIALSRNNKRQMSGTKSAIQSEEPEVGSKNMTETKSEIVEENHSSKRKSSSESEIDEENEASKQKGRGNIGKKDTLKPKSSRERDFVGEKDHSDEKSSRENEMVGEKQSSNRKTSRDRDIAEEKDSSKEKPSQNKEMTEEKDSSQQKSSRDTKISEEKDSSKIKSSREREIIKEKDSSKEKLSREGEVSEKKDSSQQKSSLHGNITAENNSSKDNSSRETKISDEKDPSQRKSSRQREIMKEKDSSKEKLSRDREISTKKNATAPEDVEKQTSKSNIIVEEAKEKIVTKKNVESETKEKITMTNNTIEEEEKISERNINEEKTLEKTVNEKNKKALNAEKVSTDTKIEISNDEEINEETKESNAIEKSKKNLIKEKNDNIVDSKSKSTSIKSHSSEKTISRKEFEEQTSKQMTKFEKISEESIQKISEEIAQSEILENAKKEKKDEASLIAVETKVVTKSKVDLVKRDLFSDDESNDQRTTRSKTRQTSDPRKCENNASPITTNFTPEKGSSASSKKENLPGVLECLELVPTVKSNDSFDDYNILDSSQQCHAEFMFIYDDSVVPTKRRKRKFSSNELAFPVVLNFTDCPKVMTATVFEEIFNLSPPRRRRGPAKEAANPTATSTTASSTATTLKSSRCKKKDNSVKNGKTVFKDIQEKPLATSSPVFKASTSKVKATLSPCKNIDNPTDVKKKINAKNDKEHGMRLRSSEEHSSLFHERKNQESCLSSIPEKQNSMKRKRKVSTSRDSEQVEKKSRANNPQLLLSKLDLDKFLTTVHGPIE